MVELDEIEVSMEIKLSGYIGVVLKKDLWNVMTAEEKKQRMIKAIDEMNGFLTSDSIRSSDEVFASLSVDGPENHEVSIGMFSTYSPADD
jgi:hypothetical protein